MEIPKYIQNKIKQQNEACKKASKLEEEIENWCQLSGFDPYSKEYKEIKGRLVDAVAPLNADKIKEIANTIEYWMLLRNLSLLRYRKGGYDGKM